MLTIEMWTIMSTIWSLLYLAKSLPTSVQVTVPVNPVQTGGILSLHCRVSNLKVDEEVAFYRQPLNEKLTRLSMGNTIANADDERTFLAIRQMDDSVVYFLSIVNAVKEDAGEYSCRVIGNVDGLLSQVTTDTMHVDVAYFPGDSYPVCAQPDSLEVIEGTLVRFHCMTELTQPPVDMHWSRSRDQVPELRGRISNTDSERVSELAFRATSIYDGAVFLCEISSSLFPGQLKSCHIGPLKVIPKKSNGHTKNPNSNTDMPFIVPDPSHKPTVNSTLQCRDICDSVSSNEFTWIIATVVTVLIAIIFLVLAVTMLIRYCHEVHSLNVESHRRLQRYPQEYIYTEVEGRKELEKIYMSLDRQNSNVPIKFTS